MPRVFITKQSSPKLRTPSWSLSNSIKASFRSETWLSDKFNSAYKMKISPEGLNIITDIDIDRVHVHNQLYLVGLPSLPLHLLDTFHTISDLESYRVISYNSMTQHQHTWLPLMTALSQRAAWKKIKKPSELIVEGILPCWLRTENPRVSGNTGC